MKPLLYAYVHPYGEDVKCFILGGKMQPVVVKVKQLQSTLFDHTQVFIGVLGLCGWRMVNLGKDGSVPVCLWFEQELPDVAQVENTIGRLRAALGEAGLLA